MSYTPTEWQPDDIVTAARMNTLETAVGEMNMSYTPNTWVNGDVITAAKMNALEQAVASGGGSSDFSTAEVTIVNDTHNNIDIMLLPIVSEIDEGVYGLVGASAAQLNASHSETYIVGLYQGLCAWATALYDSYASYTFTGSGSVTVLDVVLIITGDCTITIS